MTNPTNHDSQANIAAAAKRRLAPWFAAGFLVSFYSAGEIAKSLGSAIEGDGPMKPDVLTVSLIHLALSFLGGALASGIGRLATRILRRSGGIADDPRG